MIQEYVKYWDKDKDKLKEFFKNNNINSYEQLVKAIVDVVINPNLYNTDDDIINADNITTIDFGDYQGSLIFVLAKDTYQPTISQHLYTYIDYGSCSGCDSLKRASEEKENGNIDAYVNIMMSICLHLFQNLHYFK